MDAAKDRRPVLTPAGVTPARAAMREPEEAERALSRIQSLLDAFEDNHPSAEKVTENLNDDEKSEIRSVLKPLHPADVAYILQALPTDDRMIVWDLAESNHDGEVLVEVNNDGVRETLIDAMDREELVDAMESLDTDEIADLVEDLPPDVVEEVQEGLSTKERAQLRAAMSYPEDSVGARMDFDLVLIREDDTVEGVLRYLKTFEELPDHFDLVFVVDRQQKLKGVVQVTRLLLSDPERSVQEVMNTDVLSLNPTDSASDAAQAFERYDLVSAPVVDEGNRLLGRLTVNEVVDVIREESDEDAYSAVGLDDDEDPFGSVWNSAKSRWVWLGVNMCTAFFASSVINVFEGTISKVVALATLMPIVSGIAGNTGNQTLTLLVRSLATGQVTDATEWDLFKKEFAIALLNGVIWGAISGFAAFLIYHNSPVGRQLGLVMFLAMMLNIVVGALVGVIVPVVLKKLGRDPAMGSSVLLTFITDSCGFLIFLGLASVIFK